MKRTKLKDRLLPSYCKGEEIMNTVTHIAGGGLGILAGLMYLLRAILTGGLPDIAGALVYGICLVALYSVSSIYHGLRPGNGKKVMQVIDHCAIYFLIAGTYTPILLTGFVPLYPRVGWGLLLLQWGLCALATTLTAIDLKKYTVFSMICYIGMGWSIIFFIPQCMAVMTLQGFYWLLSGGIVYTLGAVLYGIGAKKPWFHSVFHIFVIFGSLLQFVAIFFFLL